MARPPVRGSHSQDGKQETYLEWPNYVCADLLSMREDSPSKGGSMEPMESHRDPPLGEVTSLAIYLRTYLRAYFHRSSVNSLPARSAVVLHVA